MGSFGKLGRHGKVRNDLGSREDLERYGKIWEVGKI